MKDFTSLPIRFKSGQPCNHKGCLSHKTHPCEGCGRIEGLGDVRLIPSLLDTAMMIKAELKEERKMLRKMLRKKPKR